ncbi:MFS transporter [Candidatus Bathyarchaeota archaeon]|nr:MFS transporter [Candidatus Bathyarchaeota archaeon]
MSVSTTPAPAVALFLVANFGSIMGMRIAYVIVIALFLCAAILRLKLKESIQNTETPNLKKVLSSYPQALTEGISVWKKVPRSTIYLLISSLLFRFASTMTMPLLLVYAFYVMQIGGSPNLAIPPEQDPVLQLAREKWGYVNIVLFISMIFLSIPTGKIIDKMGRKKPLILSGIFSIPAVILFVYGNYVTLFLSLILWGASQLLGYSAFQALFADLVPQSQRGKVIGSMNFFTYLLMAAGGILGGVLYDYVSPRTPFLLMLALIVPSIILIIYGIKEPKPEERED